MGNLDDQVAVDENDAVGGVAVENLELRPLDGMTL